MLISDIELSLKKINSFANWSCGILATISIFVTTTYLNFFKDSIPKEELSKLLIDENAGLQNDLVVFFSIVDVSDNFRITRLLSCCSSLYLRYAICKYYFKKQPLH